MIASRLTSILFFAVAFTSTLVASAPFPAERQVSSVSDILTTLQSELSSVLPQIDTLVSSATANDDTVTPLIQEVVSALDGASSSLSGLTLGGAEKEEVAGTVTDVAQSLDGLLSVADDIPSLGGLLSSVDTSLSQVVDVSGTETEASGILSLVTGLVDVPTLESLGFDSTLASLGL
ncbi:uncharacterized protein ARMOST_01431 [Armillaria ostoyae]|uniref:Uncharacterized protein n=1 Tax=Armillaria ostoyae TaxID=47428 RepID=A0A284QP55_ARMOS|nr:uncharacterized protein ARMOST_01431 [Armillaria ostoyae]